MPYKHAKKSIIKYDNPILDAIIIKKHGYRRAIIDSITDITMLYNVVTTCFWIAFEFPFGEWAIIDGISQFILFAKFCSKFISETTLDGVRVRKFHLIAWKYLRFWLILDLLALIPFRWFGYELVGYYCRMSRLGKLSRILNFFDNSGVGVFVNILAGTRNMTIP